MGEDGRCTVQQLEKRVLALDTPLLTATTDSQETRRQTGRCTRKTAPFLPFPPFWRHSLGDSSLLLLCTVVTSAVTQSRDAPHFHRSAYAVSNRVMMQLTHGTLEAVMGGHTRRQLLLS